MSRLLPRVVLAVFAVLLVVAVVATVLRHTTRYLGTNGIGPSAFVVAVPPGEAACQAVQPVPAGTKAVRVTLGSYGNPRARVRAGAGQSPAGPAVTVQDGPMELPLSEDGAGAGVVCVANVGSGQIELAGVAAAPAQAALVHNKPAKGAIGFDYLSGPPDRWIEEAGDIFARIGYAKGIAGGAATGAVLVLLLLAALGGALALCWKVVRP